MCLLPEEGLPMRFDGATIIQTTIDQVMQEHSRVAQRLWWSGMAGDPAAAYQSSLLAQELALLVQVANGEIDRAAAGEARYFEVQGVLQDVCMLLWQPPIGPAGYHVPADFWTQPGIGAVCGAVLEWLNADDLITISEAAHILYADADEVGSNVATQRVLRLISRGKINAYQASADTEPNPRRRRRVKRSEVLLLRGIHDPDNLD
jgi:hypothetical protein